MIDIKKHEWLRLEDYYESRSTGTKARTNKTCVCCGGSIPKGTPHDMHHFYPEFYAVAVHKNCHDDFMKSLLTEEDLLKQKENDED